MTRTEMIRASWGAWMNQAVEPVGPRWWQFVWTVLFAMVVAAGFTVVGFAMYASGEGAWRNLAGWVHWYLNYLVVSLAIGFSNQGLFALGRRALGRARIQRFTPLQRWLYYPVVSLSALLIGLAIGLPMIDLGPARWALPNDANALVASLLLSLLAWFMFQSFFSSRAKRLAAERRAAQAQLRLLQAQMEPHFLFNTLANVVGLMEADTPRAKAMLESFTDYLRGSLVSLREPEHALGAELDLVEAYLRVVKVRMEDRLHYRIDATPELRALKVPALSVQPLVENAVLHGLEPHVEGGRLAVEVRRESDLLVICVSDDGVGLAAVKSSARTGAGVALQNLRERLGQSFDARARLQLAAAAPRGTCATLTLPITSAMQRDTTP
jgi:signal transduction histidine kinase